MPRFEKLRVSLAREDGGPLLEVAADGTVPLDRSEYLRRAFGEARQFLNSRGTKFTFHPIATPEGYAAGFFARERPVPLTHADLTPYMAENYDPALCVISLDRDQTVWMQDANAGSPKGVLEAYFDFLLTRTDLKDWAAYVRYFENETDYWTVVREHRREITKITFRYVPPNAFEGRKLAQQYHSAVQAQSKAPVVEETFKGPAGSMDPEAEMMQANAEIAEQGAGEREIRGINNKLLYKSQRGKVTDEVDEEEMPTVEQPTFVRRVINRLFEQ
jgi:hypothetical protein